MPDVLDRKPVRTFLHERETLLPHKKIVDVLGIGYPADYEDVWGDLIREFAQGPPPPTLDRVRPEEAIEVMAGSTWAHGLAEGVCGPRYVGLPPGSPEYDRCVYNVSHKVAARSLRMEWSPPPTPTPAPARPPRRRSVFWSPQESQEELREKAREWMLRGEPLTDEMMIAFTEYPFPGMRMLRFRRVHGGWKMTGGPLGGELGYERDLSFDEVIAEIKEG